MRRKIIDLVLFISLLLAPLPSCATELNHLQKLKSKFPYGLLTDDYGILTESDLMINACAATPVALTTTSISYQYWQCFESKVVSFKMRPQQAAG